VESLAAPRQRPFEGHRAEDAELVVRRRPGPGVRPGALAVDVARHLLRAERPLDVQLRLTEGAQVDLGGQQ
jgi:hypothetical protein